jgi:hypothetical protein
MTDFWVTDGKNPDDARFYSNWIADHVVMSSLLFAWQSIHHTKDPSYQETHAAIDPFFTQSVSPIFANHADPWVHFEAYLLERSRMRLL